MRLQQISFSLLLLLPALAEAQPADPRPGTCYANCFIPDVYQTITEQVALSPAYTRTILSAPEFVEQKKYLKIQDESSRFLVKVPVLDTIEERIEIKPPTKKFIIVPAVYKKLAEPILAKPESKRLISLPAVYETVSEQILVAPAVSTYTASPAELKPYR